MKLKLVLISVVMSTVAATQASASPWETDEYCTARASDSFSCVSVYGYKGKDPYGLDAYSKFNYTDGTKHGCTSFAAYMLSIKNPWIPGLTHFDAARSWAHDAKTKTTGAIVDHEPAAGDIAQWGQPTDADSGHVAYVEEVQLDSNGVAIGIKLADDNGGSRTVSTKKTIMKAHQTTALRWPDNFITFPQYGALNGGGKNGMMMTSIRITP